MSQGPLRARGESQGSPGLSWHPVRPPLTPATRRLPAYWLSVHPSDRPSIHPSLAHCLPGPIRRPGGLTQVIPTGPAAQALKGSSLLPPRNSIGVRGSRRGEQMGLWPGALLRLGPGPRAPGGRGSHVWAPGRRSDHPEGLCCQPPAPRAPGAGREPCVGPRGHIGIPQGLGRVLCGTGLS